MAEPILSGLIGATPRERAENVRPRMAKADLRKADVTDFRADVGWVIQRASSLLGWSLKELAAHVDRDPRQVARWIDGKERPHLDALWAVAELRMPLIQAFAELVRDQDVEVSTTIRMRVAR